MTPHSRTGWLLTTINAVREIMVKKLAKRTLDAETEREMQMALDMIETIWEELRGQSDLLMLEQRRYECVFEFSPDAYAVTDAGGNVREANHALAELLGLARTDLLGKPLMHWIAAQERTTFLENFIGVGRDARGAPRAWRSTLQPAQGPAREAIVSVRAMPLDRSGVAGLCWLFRAE
jgi:PAS domain S-box-containing protein